MALAALICLPAFIFILPWAAALQQLGFQGLLLGALFLLPPIIGLGYQASKGGLEW